MPARFGERKKGKIPLKKTINLPGCRFQGLTLMKRMTKKVFVNKLAGGAYIYLPTMRNGVAPPPGYPKTDPLPALKDLTRLAHGMAFFLNIIFTL